MNATPIPGAAAPSRGYARAAFVAIVGAAMVVIYAMLPGTQSAFHTWGATLLALALVWGYVLHQHGGRIPLRSDTLALGGFTLTHLLPALYLSLRAGSPVVDAFGVGEFQPLVSLLAGGAAAVMLITFRALHRRLGGTGRLIPPPARPMNMTRAVAVFLPVAAVVLAARAYLLVSGAYYWVYNEESFVFGRWYSVTVTISRYGLLLPVGVWLLAAQDRRWRVWAWVASAAELAWVVPSGARQPLLETVFAFLLVTWWRSGRLPRGRILAVLAVATITMPILGEYRETIGRYTGKNEVSLDATVQALWDAHDQLGFEGSAELADRFVDRLYDGQYFGYLLKHYRASYDWEYGKTYADRLPYVVVPYFVGGERPTMQVPMELWFKLILRGTVPTTLLGESYVNFGLFGIPLVAAALGVILALYEAAFRRLRGNVFLDAVYLVHGAMMPFMVTQSLSQWVSFLRNALLMMFALLVLVRLVSTLGATRAVPAPAGAAGAAAR